MDAWLPWIDYPGVTLEKLLIVANIIRTIRNEAVDDHRPDKFETNWSLGVRQYERTEGALTWASQQYPWLTILAGAGAGGGAAQYVFAISGHAIRFCRGDEEEVALRYQAPCFPELVQQSLLDPAAANVRCLRLVITNTADGRPGELRLMEIDATTGEPLRSYFIPDSESTITEFAPPPAPVSIPPVAAEPADDAAAEEHKTGSDDE